MDNTFNGCKSLKSLDISSFNTEKVNRLDYTFSNCISLTSLNLASFNTNKCTSFKETFQNCKMDLFIGKDSSNLKENVPAGVNVKNA